MKRGGHSTKQSSTSDILMLSTFATSIQVSFCTCDSMDMKTAVLGMTGISSAVGKGNKIE